MTLKRAIYGCMVGLVAFFVMNGTSVFAAPVSLAFDVDITYRYPVDANLYETQDPTKIAGFCSDSDLVFQNTKIGDITLCAMTGPYDPTELYTEMSQLGRLTIPGIGQCKIEGEGIAMNIGEAGNFILKWIGALTSCTNQLQDFEGLIDGQGTDNLNDPTFSQDHYTMNLYLQFLGVPLQ